jgi:zinc/manganese transport system permease protein
MKFTVIGKNKRAILIRTKENKLYALVFMKRDYKSINETLANLRLNLALVEKEKNNDSSEYKSPQISTTAANQTSGNEKDVIILSSLFSRVSNASSDNILTVFYLFSLSLGVLIMSISGSNLDLLNFLFGNIFAINNETILMLGIITSLTLVTIFLISRALIIEIVDPLFFSSVSKIGGLIDIIFMILVVLNLIASFQAIGTLMGIGIMVIPSISLRFWTNNLFKIIIFSIITALLSSYIALIISFHVNISCSPLIIIILTSFFLLSFILGKRNGIIWNYIKTKHYED